MEWIILGIVLVLVLFTLVRCIRIVQQAKAYVVERLGAYKRPGTSVSTSRCLSSSAWPRS